MTVRAIVRAWRVAKRSSLLGELAIFLFFVAATIVMTWPYAKLATTQLPAVGIDDGLNIARYTKNFHDWLLLRRSGPLFDFDFFFPHPLVGTTNDPGFGLGALTLPLLPFTHNYLFLVNFATLASFPLAAHGTYLLVRELTRSRGAGVIAGLAFAFSFFRLHHLDHANCLQIQWLPYALTYLHRMQRSPSWKNTFLLALFVFAACAASCNLAMYSVWLFPLVGAFAVAGARRWLRPRCASRIALAGTLAAVALIPIYRPFLQAANLWLPVRQPWELVQFSGRVESFYAAPSGSALYAANAVYAFNESPMFVGFFVLGFATLAIVWFGRSARRMPLVWWRYLYLAVAGLTALLSLGPQIKYRDHVLAKGIWDYLAVLPGYQTVRTPARFYFITILCLSILAGAGAGMLLGRARARWTQIAFFGALSMGLLFELRAMPVGMRAFDDSPRAAAVYRALIDAPQPGAVADLPVTWDQPIRTRMYHQMVHGRPTVDGMSSYGLYYFNMMGDDQLQGALGRRTVAELNAAGLRYVILRAGALNAEQHARYLAILSSAGAKLWRTVDGHEIYELGPPPPTVPLTRDRISVSVVQGTDRWAPSGTTMSLEVRLVSNIDQFIFEKGPRWLDFLVAIQTPDGVIRKRLPIGLAPALMAPHGPQQVVYKYLPLKLPPGNYSIAYRVSNEEGIWSQGSTSIAVTAPKP